MISKFSIFLALFAMLLVGIAVQGEDLTESRVKRTSGWGWSPPAPPPPPPPPVQQGWGQPVQKGWSQPPPPPVQQGWGGGQKPFRRGGKGWGRGGGEVQIAIIAIEPVGYAKGGGGWGSGGGYKGGYSGGNGGGWGGGGGGGGW